MKHVHRSSGSAQGRHSATRRGRRCTTSPTSSTRRQQKQQRAYLARHEDCWKSSSASPHEGAVKRTKQARRACASTRSDGAVKEAWSRRVAMTKRALIQHQDEYLCPSTGLLERLKNKIDEFFIIKYLMIWAYPLEEIMRTSRTRSSTAT